MHKIYLPMALLMSLILGSGLAAFTSNSASAQNYGYQDDYYGQSYEAIIVTIANTQPKIRHMNVKQVHLKASLQVQ